MRSSHIALCASLIYNKRVNKLVLCLNMQFNNIYNRMHATISHLYCMCRALIFSGNAAKVMSEYRIVRRIVKRWETSTQLHYYCVRHPDQQRIKIIPTGEWTRIYVCVRPTDYHIWDTIAVAFVYMYYNMQLVTHAEIYLLATNICSANRSTRLDKRTREPKKQISKEFCLLYTLFDDCVTPNGAHLHSSTSCDCNPTAAVLFVCVVSPFLLCCGMAQAKQFRHVWWLKYNAKRNALWRMAKSNDPWWRPITLSAHVHPHTYIHIVKLNCQVELNLKKKYAPHTCVLARSGSIKSAI